MVTAPAKPWIVVVSDTKSIDHVLRTNFDNYIKGSLRTRTHTHAHAHARTHTTHCAIKQLDCGASVDVHLLHTGPNMIKILHDFLGDGFAIRVCVCVCVCGVRVCARAWLWC
jgi:hypothetical protein